MLQLFLLSEVNCFVRWKRKGTLETKCLMRMRLGYGSNFCHQELSYTVEKGRLKISKKSKERVTLLACSNAAGTCRLPLMFIHTSAKPRCFKHMDMNSLHVHYYLQKKAWMDSTLFESWFHDRFVSYAKKFCQDIDKIVKRLNTKYYYFLIMHLPILQ